MEASSNSFIGGHPHLPPELALPICTKCKKPLTFFYQVAFPKDHFWASRSLAVFACTSTWHPYDLIPPLLPQPRDVVIPADFLTDYQTTFRLLVFPTQQAVLRTDYVPRVKFTPWNLVKAGRLPLTASKIGGTPRWSTGQESPSSYAGRPLTFLMQLGPHVPFEWLEEAPSMARDPQFARLLPDPSHYDLFVGNVIYLWGTHDDGPEAVYTLVQRP